MKKYSQLLVFILIIISVVLVIQYFVPHLVLWHTWAVIGYFSFLSFLTFLLVEKAIKEDAFGFYNFFMASAAIRLLLSAVVLFIYYYNFKETRINFTFTFFISYFLFVGFEIKTLLSKLHTKSDKPEQQDENYTL